ncbi:RraA family protein [Gracilimonas mengyeensis]|uniref:RraA family protein n=1 Tax=Gracilimonas mengyeensis TaxID=1302730 RepID=UPI0011577A78|nr:RraA family protein [Gracilimonas mengyeensis]
MKKLSGCLLLFCLVLGVQAGSQAQTISKEKLIWLTPKWEGERFEDGRPKVPDHVLERMQHVSIEEAWGIIRNYGYHNQFAGGNWRILNPGEVVVGRAVTAQYMPTRPAIEERIINNGEADGRSGPMNTWPIDELVQGDVYVADGFGKVKDGTLIGDRLGTTIYANSGNGVVFDGSSRDMEGLSQIEGFNAFVRAWDPSYLQQMMLMGLNTPIMIGEATVLPGDVVLAKKTGIIFIPAHLAEVVVDQSEVIRLTDIFAHQSVQEGTYTAGQMDTDWTEDIKADFFEWLQSNKNKLHEEHGIGLQTINRIIENREI